VIGVARPYTRSSGPCFAHAARISPASTSAQLRAELARCV
jgi:hypothetical protein